MSVWHEMGTNTESASEPSYFPEIIRPRLSAPESETPAQITRFMAFLRESAKRYPYDYNYYKKFYRAFFIADKSRAFRAAAKFAAEITDAYEGGEPFMAYYPDYAQMSQRQLRTYFTWRVGARRGVYGAVSPSYVFVYAYELINNIGVSPPLGAEKLLELWHAYEGQNPRLEWYFPGWLLDYHVVNGMGGLFPAFVRGGGLSRHYPGLCVPRCVDGAESFYAVSSYNIKRSVFYRNGGARTVDACAEFLLSRLRALFAECGLLFDAQFIRAEKSAYTPFSNALYHPPQSADGVKTVCGGAIYVCSRGNWQKKSFKVKGRALAGYILKTAEAALREAENFKKPLKAVLPGSAKADLLALTRRGINLEAEIQKAVADFSAERRRVRVSVDPKRAKEIRLQADEIFKALSVTENER